jgi:hypothetical protein
MGDRNVHVVLKFDSSRFVEGMKRAVEVAACGFHAAALVERFTAAWWSHQRRHHRRELPWRSAMHAAYDRRRRARRRRNR